MNRALRSAAAGAVGVLAVGMLVGPAHASVPAPVGTVLVGVGSDTTQDVIGALAEQYTGDSSANRLGDNVTSINAAGGPYGAPGDLTCLDGVAYPENGQPNGSSAGIAALTQTDPRQNCLDFARSSRARTSSDPSYLAFHAFAKDAVTWASYSAGHAPANLTQAQLQQIYTCQITDWAQVGGASGPIRRYLPPSGSGTRSFFVAKLLGGVTIPAGCPVTTVAENDGSQVPAADRPNAILPYSVAKWTAQAHGVSPDQRTGAVLGQVGGTAPTTANIATGAFPAVRHVYNVTRTDTNQVEQAKLDQLFGTGGYLCTSAAAHDTIIRYGFVPESEADCGTDLG